MNLEAVGALVSAIKNNPKNAETVWKSSVTWDGGFRAVAGTGPGNKFTVVADEPTSIGGTGTAPNPVEILLSALGQCLAIGYAAAASVHGVSIRSLNIDLEGDLNIIPFLGLGEAHGSDHAGYRGIRVNVNLDAEADKAVLDAIHAHVVKTSPVGHTVGRPVEVKYSLNGN